jgi:hypothetical protein
VGLRADDPLNPEEEEEELGSRPFPEKTMMENGHETTTVSCLCVCVSGSVPVRQRLPRTVPETTVSPVLLGDNLSTHATHEPTLYSLFSQSLLPQSARSWEEGFFFSFPSELFSDFLPQEKQKKKDQAGISSSRLLFFFYYTITTSYL